MSILPLRAPNTSCYLSTPTNVSGKQIEKEVLLVSNSKRLNKEPGGFMMGRHL